MKTSRLSETSSLQSLRDSSIQLQLDTGENVFMFKIKIEMFKTVFLSFYWMQPTSEEEV